MSTKADDEELEERHITEVHEDGTHVLLDDDSSWDIQPGPSTKVVLWYSPQRVTVEEYENGEYTLTNLDTSGPDRVQATPGFWDPDNEEEEEDDEDEDE